MWIGTDHVVRCLDFTEANWKVLEDTKRKSDMIRFTVLKDYSGGYEANRIQEKREEAKIRQKAV